MRGRFLVGETFIDVTADADLGNVQQYIREARLDVERKILAHATFGTTFSPLGPEPDDPETVVRMCNASLLSGVGPMAAVAGAVAAHVVERLHGEGCDYVVADNGGDVALFTDRPCRIALYSGDGAPEFAFEVPATNGLLGICTSSAKVGPSVSFGDSDMCTVVSKNPALADACATALGNEAKKGCDLFGITERICGIEGVLGCLVVLDGNIAVCGDIPRIVHLQIQ